VSIDRLYKYGRLNNYSEELFSSAQIWFACPPALNDPFECRPWFTFEGTEEQIVGTLVRELQKRDPLATQASATARVLSICRQGRHRDPHFWEPLRAGVLQKLSRDIGLYCLSRDQTSILMWSHYAQDHEGYCLEFEATNYTAIFGGAQEVHYSDDYPSVDFYNTSNDEQVKLIFLTKYTGWTYEKEWRIVDHQLGPGLRTYRSELLKGVIFGLRMPEDDKAQIRQWLARRGHPVQFYQAVLHARKFAIEIKEID
jgi:hypothetical protein